jgi:hypothetical protein
MLARTLSISLLAAACAAGSAQAGTRLEMLNRDLSGGRTTTITTWAQDGKLRVQTQPNQSVMIFKDDTIYAISPRDQSYIVMDRASMKRMADQINPGLKMLQEQMKNMTPEQRAQMEKMLGGRLPVGDGSEARQEIKRTSRTDKINGYSCTYVEVREAGTLTDELCVAPGSALQGSDELMSAANKMSALMQDMMASMDAPWLQQMAQKQLQNFEALGGVPVLSRNYVDGKPQTETTLSKIGSETVAPALFEIPAGYTRKDMLPAR